MPIEPSYVIGPNVYKASLLIPGLYLVATPIGNLLDITLRALETLAAVDIIACEDVRVSLKLLNHYSIKAKLLSYHEHNAEQIGPKLISAIASGQAVALISDAGTPLISDPGFDLVQQAWHNKLSVIPIPGACAAITALMGAGMPTNQFSFIGFLPPKQLARQKKLNTLANAADTLIFYESPHRLVKTLYDMSEIFGAHRKAAICRELTKKFETYNLNTLGTLYEYYAHNIGKLGEVVIIIEPAPLEKIEYSNSELERLLAQHLQTMPAAKAALAVAKITGVKKQHLYKMLLEH